MRWIVVVIAVAGCGPTAEGALEACDFEAECVTGTRCDFECRDRILARRDCCECLVEFDCTDATAERCFTNLSEGGAVNVAAGCAQDQARCGVACGDVLVFDED
jgi:hypothetical protein